MIIQFLLSPVSYSDSFTNLITLTARLYQWKEHTGQTGAAVFEEKLPVSPGVSSESRGHPPPPSVPFLMHFSFILIIFLSVIDPFFMDEFWKKNRSCVTFSFVFLFFCPYFPCRSRHDGCTSIYNDFSTKQLDLVIAELEAMGWAVENHQQNGSPKPKCLYFLFRVWIHANFLYS